MLGRTKSGTYKVLGVKDLCISFQKKQKEERL